MQYEGKKLNNCIELSSAENYESIKCGDLSFVFVILLALRTWEDNSQNKLQRDFFPFPCPFHVLSWLIL